jgi:hypothetical protein
VLARLHPLLQHRACFDSGTGGEGLLFQRWSRSHQSWSDVLAHWAPARHPRRRPPLLKPHRVRRDGGLCSFGHWQYRVIGANSNTSDITTAGEVRSKGVFIHIVMEVTNLGSENVALDAAALTLFDDAGRKYNIDPSVKLAYLIPWRIDGQARSEARFGDQMPPGVTLVVRALYDVNPSAASWTLHLEPGNVNIGLKVRLCIPSC